VLQALPGWCSLLAASASFLFGEASRRKLLAVSAFGVSRAVEHLQQASAASSTRELEHALTTLNEQVIAMYMTGQEPTALQAKADSIEDRIRGRRLRHHLGVPRHDYVNGVRRASVLEDAK
jgi:hypothetical protein